MSEQHAAILDRLAMEWRLEEEDSRACREECPEEVCEPCERGILDEAATAAALEAGAAALRRPTCATCRYWSLQSGDSLRPEGVHRCANHGLVRCDADDFCSWHTPIPPAEAP